MKVGQHRRVLIIANGLFGEQLAGGDVHLLHSIRAFCVAGHEVECLSGQALARHVLAWGLCASVRFMDGGSPGRLTDTTLPSKVRLFLAYLLRLIRTLRYLRHLAECDVAFAPTDYWFDVLPLFLSRARLKVMVLQMESPSLWQVVMRSRADVERSRMASLHYCLSQSLSLGLLRLSRNKRVICVQSLLRDKLLKKGYRDEEVVTIPNGVDVTGAQGADAVEKDFDVAWIGRMHRQKGVDDLLVTLEHLAKEVPRFRAVLIGRLRDALGPEIERRGLAHCVEFAGFVQGTAKYRYLKRSRVFLMPSRHEGLPIVVCEALACGLPVVAYELPMYRPFFGALVRYVNPFDLDAFTEACREMIFRARAGEDLLDHPSWERFVVQNDWRFVENRLAALLDDVRLQP